MEFLSDDARPATRLDIHRDRSGVQPGHLLPRRSGRLGRDRAAQTWPEKAGVDREHIVLQWVRDRQSGTVDGSHVALLPGLRSHRRRGDRPGVCHARGDGGQVVPGPQGARHGNGGDGFRNWGAVAEQVARARPGGLQRGRSADGIPGTGDHLRLHPDPREPAVVGSAAGAGAGCSGRRSVQGIRGGRRRCEGAGIPHVAAVFLHVGGLFLQHRGGHFRHQLSVGTAAGCLGTGGTDIGTRDTGGLWRHPDRRQLGL